MGKRKAKFKVGDIVINYIYGTVGNITRIHFFDDQYLYEVNHGNVLYLESALKLFSEFEGDIYENEAVEITYQYCIGDLVEVTGHPKQLFKVIGLRTEIWRYAEDGWEDTVYELTRVHDDEWLEAAEDELVLVMKKAEAQNVFQKIFLMYYLGKNEPSSNSTYKLSLTAPIQPALASNINQKLIDELLDLYNDYFTLYQMFKDEEYKEIMNLIVQSLKRYSNE